MGGWTWVGPTEAQIAENKRRHTICLSADITAMADKELWVRVNELHLEYYACRREILKRKKALMAAKAAQDNK
jgi:hypothetical protein